MWKKLIWQVLGYSDSMLDQVLGYSDSMLDKSWREVEEKFHQYCILCEPIEAVPIDIRCAKLISIWLYS